MTNAEMQTKSLCETLGIIGIICCVITVILAIIVFSYVDYDGKRHFGVGICYSFYVIFVYSFVIYALFSYSA